MVDLILGVDVGTSSTKVVVFNLDGQEIARAQSKPYRNFTPYPGWVEQNPDEIWEALILTLKEVVTGLSAPKCIRSICLSVQSGSLIPLGKNGEPLSRMITWLDGRAQEIVAEWKSIGEQKWIRNESGWSLYPGLCLPTIAWIKKNQPSLFDHTCHFVSLNDYLVYRLCGQFVSNPSNAGGMQLINISDGRWSEALLAFVGIEEKQLSSLLPSGEIIAPLLPSVSQQIGFSTAIPLVNGGHDQVCTAFGMGINEPGRWLLAGGTAWVFTGILDAVVPMESLPASLDFNFHADNQRWTASQSLGGLGASFEWWLSQAYQNFESREQLFQQLNKELDATGFDPLLVFLPLTGGHADPATTRRGGFSGVQLGHQRADFARAVMQACAYELKWAFEAVRTSDMPVKHLWMVGGAAANPFWCQILADVLNIPISLPGYDNWSALGAAVLGGIGIGLFDSISEALEKFQRPERLITPDIDQIQDYLMGFDQYKQQVNLLQKNLVSA